METFPITSKSQTKYTKSKMYQVDEMYMIHHIYFIYLLVQFLLLYVWHESYLLSFCWTMFSAVLYYMESDNPKSLNCLMCWNDMVLSLFFCFKN